MKLKILSELYGTNEKKLIEDIINRWKQAKKVMSLDDFINEEAENHTPKSVKKVLQLYEKYPFLMSYADRYAMTSVADILQAGIFDFIREAIKEIVELHETSSGK